jgi:hypothetical protein
MKNTTYIPSQIGSCSLNRTLPSVVRRKSQIDAEEANLSDTNTNDHRSLQGKMAGNCFCVVLIQENMRMLKKESQSGSRAFVR